MAACRNLIKKWVRDSVVYEAWRAWCMREMMKRTVGLNHRDICVSRTKQVGGGTGSDCSSAFMVLKKLKDFTMTPLYNRAKNTRAYSNNPKLKVYDTCKQNSDDHRSIHTHTHTHTLCCVYTSEGQTEDGWVVFHRSRPQTAALTLSAGAVKLSLRCGGRQKAYSDLVTSQRLKRLL